jgi:hypothetical protein
MIERGYSFLFKLCKKMKSEYEISIFMDFAGKGFEHKVEDVRAFFKGSK